MIVIVDNGKNAEEISKIIRGSRITKPNHIPDADAYILTDGSNPINKDVQKHNMHFIKSNKKPVLGIGVGYLCLAMTFGAKIKTSSVSSGTEKIIIKRRSPILLDLKKTFNVVDNQKYVIEACPDSLGPIASSSKYEFEIIQHGSGTLGEDPLPFFGVHFNPELGLDGRKIIDNFIKLVDVWNKYHK